MSLDEKLKSLDIEFLHGVPVHLPMAAIEQIKQAFIDEGWVKLRNHEPGEKCYTGQEWYDRFEEELKATAFEEQLQGYEDHSLIYTAARRASGLEEKA